MRPPATTSEDVATFDGGLDQMVELRLTRLRRRTPRAPRGRERRTGPTRRMRFGASWGRGERTGAPRTAPYQADSHGDTGRPFNRSKRQ
jgi:hypothetical protein